MKILFSSTPAYGHVIPLLPLARAAQQDGHEVALLTHASLAHAAGDVPVLPVGPALDVMIGEAIRRTGADIFDTVAMAPEIFGGVRLDLTSGDALAAARSFGPDLLVCEAADYVGPLVAATLGVPWAMHGISQPLPEELTQAIEAVAAARYAERGLEPTPHGAFVDPWPAALQPSTWTAPADLITIRPQPHRSDDPWSGATFPGREDRPQVLLTLGTVVSDQGLLNALLSSVLTQDVNVVLTLGPGGDPDAFDADRSRVHPVGFVPLERLLGGTNLVVGAGGAGTVLGALSRGLPLVLLPVLADQPWIAGRVAELGAAVVVSDPGEVAGAVDAVLTNPAYRAAAARVAEGLQAMNPPEVALRLVLDRVAQKAPR